MLFALQIKTHYFLFAPEGGKKNLSKKYSIVLTKCEGRVILYVLKVKCTVLQYQQPFLLLYYLILRKASPKPKSKRIYVSVKVNT